LQIVPVLFIISADRHQTFQWTIL